MEVLIFIMLVYILLGYAGMKMADKRGRNKLLGFVLGFCFGILALIGYGIAGNSDEKQADLVAKKLKENE